MCPDPRIMGEESGLIPSNGPLINQRREGEGMEDKGFYGLNSFFSYKRWVKIDGNRRLPQYKMFTKIVHQP